MADLLALTDGLPEVELAPGEVLIGDGTATGAMWVLVSGTLEVRKDGVRISTVSEPGAAFGEIAVLLGSGHSADVVAVSPCRLRHAVDGRALLLGHPEVLLLVAGGLARRLDLVTRYLADLRNQYQGTPGLEMVADVLGKLNATGTPARPGSARDPDPEY